MALLSYNDITSKKLIELNGDVYEVVDYQVSRKQQNKPVNRTKLRNVMSGKVIDYTFHVSDKVKEAEVERRDVKFEYINHKKGEVVFSDPDNPKDRFVVSEDFAGESIGYIVPGSVLKMLVYENDDGEEVFLAIKYPITVELEVKSAPPAVKGDTATGGSKIVVLETGERLSVPLFVSEGDVVKINLEKKSYIERVN